MSEKSRDGSRNFVESLQLAIHRTTIPYAENFLADLTITIPWRSQNDDPVRLLFWAAGYDQA